METAHSNAANFTDYAFRTTVTTPKHYISTNFVYWYWLTSTWSQYSP